MALAGVGTTTQSFPSPVLQNLVSSIPWPTKRCICKAIEFCLMDHTVGKEDGERIWGEELHKISLSNQIHTKRFYLLLDFPDDFKDTNNQET